MGTGSDDDGGSDLPPTELGEREPPILEPVQLHIISESSWYVPLKDGRYLIGRSPKQCNVVIPLDPKVSAVHLELIKKNGRVSIRDLDSTNAMRLLYPGGHVGRRPVALLTDMQPGDGVMIGGTELWLELVAAAEPKPNGHRGLIGKSRSMRAVFADAERLGPRKGTILITGETGTGKDMLARALHEASGRMGAFVAVNCNDFRDPQATESALFGHVKGGYTGAEKERLGAFRSADGGTLFLDELGDLDKENQGRLLRVLQDGIVKPMGTDTLYKVDVRVVCATHRNIAGMVATGGMRDDLYYRLHVFAIHLPPLSERYGDMPLLLDALTRKHMGDHHRTEPLHWPKDVVDALTALDWPGNVRQLDTFVQRVLGLADGVNTVTLELINRPGVLQQAKAAAPSLTLDIGGKSLDTIMEDAFITMLHHHRGNAAAAARELGMKERTMRRLISELKKKGRI